MAISKDKIIGYKLTTKHGNSIDFVDFIKSLQLQNTTLLMDNVAFHKTKLFKDTITSMNNIVLYTPPYNPIELVFSKIKSTYRKLNFIKDTLEDNILESIACITTNDLNAFYRHVQEIVSQKTLTDQKIENNTLGLTK